MINIRKGIFETNSSSVHSICISKNKDYDIPKSFHFALGEFGWENEWYSDSRNLGAYLYTAIVYGKFYDVEKFKNHIYKTLGKYGCECTFEEPRYNKEWHYLENGCIDHVDETQDFVNTVMRSEKKLLRFLFGDSFIITGNDNEDEYYDVVSEYNSKDYEVFEKGN